VVRSACSTTCAHGFMELTPSFGKRYSLFASAVSAIPCPRGIAVVRRGLLASAVGWTCSLHHRPEILTLQHLEQGSPAAISARSAPRNASAERRCSSLKGSSMIETRVGRLEIETIEDVRGLVDGGNATSCIPLSLRMPKGSVLYTEVGDVSHRVGRLTADYRARTGIRNLDKNRILLDMKLSPEPTLFSFRSGKEVLAGDVYTSMSTDTSDYRNRGETRFATICLSTDLLRQEAGEDALRQDVGFWERRRWFSPSASMRAAITQRVEHTASQLSPNITGPALRQLQSDLLEPYLWAMLFGQLKSDRRSLVSRAAIVRKVENWVDGQPLQTVHVHDLCTALRVTRRTLQRAFFETLGIGPSRYLALKRLTAARTELRQGDPRATRVTDVATKHGFWDLGRFARDYRQVFGERPSQTLSKGRFGPNSVPLAVT
jgi:AraC family ethanolamine operon transcriptional activator